MQKSTFILVLAGACIVVVAILFIFGIISFPSQNQTVNETEIAMDQTNGELIIEDIEEGTGDPVVSGDTVVIDYTGTLPDGTKFDSSVDRGEPFETQIGVGQVIQGWDEGVVGMKVGGKRKLTIPPELAYGDQALPGIPAGSTLIFEVELHEIK